MLPNGARYYVDHAHPEISTPEVTNAAEAVIWDRAADRIVQESMRHASGLLDGDAELGEAGRHGGVGAAVAAAYVEAAGSEHRGERAHGAAADAEDVHAPDGGPVDGRWSGPGDGLFGRGERDARDGRRRGCRRHAATVVRTRGAREKGHGEDP